jgi:6-hydroxytryprostatin B O-methyltransferase
MEMAPAMPKAKFIVQDFNKVALEQGQSTLAKEFPELSDRITFVDYDFFTPNTVQGDYYILRHILHDWPDKEAITIVKNLVPALKNGARIILYEAVMPEPPARLANTWDEKAVWLEDISMLAAHNAKERTCAEYEKLFKAADPNFYYVGSGRAPGAVQSTVEFEYRK